MELVVITGVTRGLGKAMAREFASRGDFVVAGCGRDKDSLAKVQRELGKQHLVSNVDVTVDSQVKRWREEVAEKFREAPTYLINNAGCLTRRKQRDPLQRVWEVSDLDFCSVIDANLKGTANVIRHFVPGMVEKKYGVVVNFITRWAMDIHESALQKDMSSMGPYMASKCGVLGLTRSLKAGLELLALREGPSFPGIRAIPFDPGTVATEMWTQAGFGNQKPDYDNVTEWAKAKVPQIIANLGEFSADEREKMRLLYTEDLKSDIQ